MYGLRGSGINASQEDRTLWCSDCNAEWLQEVDFEGAVADVRYPCPNCHEYVYYYEDKREKDDEPDYDSLEVYLNG